MAAVRLALTLSLLAGPLLATEPAERYACSVMQACDIGQPCRDDDGTVFDLAFDEAGLLVTYGGQPIRTKFDNGFRLAVWQSGEVVMQLRFVGDGSGVITVTPMAGEVERTQLRLFHCSPA